MAAGTVDRAAGEAGRETPLPSLLAREAGSEAAGGPLCSGLELAVELALGLGAGVNRLAVAGVVASSTTCVGKRSVSTKYPQIITG